MSNQPQVSVIIPTFQRCRELARALDAIKHQTLAADAFEVIVVVDGSTDGTREMLAEFSAPFALLSAWQPNRGRATACNAGIRRAEGELLVLLDDDMEPQPEWLQEHVRAHDDHRPRGVMGSAPIPIHPSSAPVTRYLANKFNEHLERLAQPGHALKLRDFYSGNFSIAHDPLRASALPNGDVFDQEFRVYGNEDLELAVRLRDAGIQLEFNPRAVAVQHNDKDFAALARDHIAKGKTAVQLLQKHPDVFAELRLATRGASSRLWRLARYTLLSASRVSSATPKHLTRLVQQLEKMNAPQLELIYQFTLDYFFWYGVETVTRTQRAHSAQNFEAVTRNRLKA